MNNFDYWDNEFTPVYGVIARRGRNCTKGVPCGNSCQKKGSVCRSNLNGKQQLAYKMAMTTIKATEKRLNNPKTANSVTKKEYGEYNKAVKAKNRLTAKSHKPPRKRRTPSNSEIDRMSNQELREKLDTTGELLKGLKKIERKGSGRKGSRHLESEYPEVFVDSRYPNLLGVEYVRELTDDLPDATIVVSDYETGVISDGEFIPISLRELDAYFGEDEEFTPVYGSVARRGKNCTKGIPCGNSCQKRGSLCRRNLNGKQQLDYKMAMMTIKATEKRLNNPKTATSVTKKEYGEYNKAVKRKNKLTAKSQTPYKVPRKRTPKQSAG